MTPLMYAAQAGHERMAVLLLRLRADRYRCNDNVCGLSWFAFRGNAFACLYSPDSCDLRRVTFHPLMIFRV